MLRRKYIALLLLLLPILSFAQSTYRKTIIPAKSLGIVNVSKISNDFHVRLSRVDSAFVGNEHYNTWFKNLKDSIEKIFPLKEVTQVKSIQNWADTTLILRNFDGNPTGSGVPNDNTLAISDGDTLISAVNTEIRIWNVAHDSVQLVKAFSLTAFSDSLHLSNSVSDPKLIYDPEYKRFMLTFFSGSSDSITDIILAFSKTGDPSQDWYLYSLPGNPFNDTTWFDYPAIALTKKDFILTGNLLHNGGTWQTSFKQSCIWQINKSDGFSGLPLTTLLWDSIQYHQVPLRNIHPVMGGAGLYGDFVYLLSNRNFAVQSDTVFLLKINSATHDQPELNIDLIHSDKAYGMPPDAHQAAAAKLATNDARVLGAFYHNNQIQFVFNCIDTNSGRPSIYHGIISNLMNSPSLHGTILSDTVDLGYPNISYTGNYADDFQSIITVNHASKTVFSGFSRYFYQGGDVYSKLATIKEGTSFAMNVYSRWGDYSGSQRKYNQPGIVWASGSWGCKIGSLRLNGTWIAELRSPFAFNPNPIPQEYHSRVFPNPTAEDFVNYTLSIPSDCQLIANLYNINGKLVKNLVNTNLKAGNFLLTFSTGPLSKGIYFIDVLKDGVKMPTEKLIINK